MTAPGEPRLRAGGMLDAAVRWKGVKLGTAVDLLLDRSARRAVGFEVECESGELRFLPLAVSEATEDGVSVTSPLALLEFDALSFYRKRGIALSELRGAPVKLNGTKTGSIADVLLRRDGTVEALIVRHGDRIEEMPATGLESPGPPRAALPPRRGED